MNIGQKVWYFQKRVYGAEAPGREVQVEKVARKWIYLHDASDFWWTGLKIERDEPNAAQEGYSARDKRGDVVGKVYVDLQAKIYARDRIMAWEKVVRYVTRYTSFRAPSHITMNDILALAQILEVDLSEPTSAMSGVAR